MGASVHDSKSEHNSKQNKANKQTNKKEVLSQVWRGRKGKANMHLWKLRQTVERAAMVEFAAAIRPTPAHPTFLRFAGS